MLIRQKKCLFHGNKLLALPERDPSFFIGNVDARESALFTGHEVIIFFTLFAIRRLEARPTATLCIDCKTLAEIKEKQIGS